MNRPRDDEHQGELFEKSSLDSLLLEPQDTIVRQAPGKKQRIGFNAFLIVLLIVMIGGAVVFGVGFEYGKSKIERMSAEERPQVEVVLKEHRQIREMSVSAEHQQPQITERVAPVTLQTTPPVTTERIDLADSPGTAQSSGVADANPDNPVVFNNAALNWTIQLVTYTQQSHVDDRMKILKGQGYEPLVIPSGKYLQVCVNRYAEKNNAAKDLSRLKKQFGYTDAYIRKIKK